MSKRSLSSEIAYYEQQKPAWLKSHLGEYVLISGKSEARFFPTFESAYSAGIEAFGFGKDFLIRQVLEQEPVFAIF